MRVAFEYSQDLVQGGKMAVFFQLTSLGQFSGWRWDFVSKGVGEIRRYTTTGYNFFNRQAPQILEKERMYEKQAQIKSIQATNSVRPWHAPFWTVSWLWGHDLPDNISAVLWIKKGH